MSRPNSHSITKATDFVKGLFKKDEQVMTTQQETEPPKTLTLSDRESSKKKDTKEKYHRADTAVGIMNKFILQFGKVEQAYREIENAFLTIVKSETQRNLKDKMKRKCEVKYIPKILDYLGYPDFTDEELKQIFNKDVTADDEITFKRLLVGSGLCYYEKQPKKKVENFVRKGKKNEDSKPGKVANQASNSESDYETDDEKMIGSSPSIDEDDLIVDPAATKRRRFRHISQGFDVVKKMFDKIDDDSSGEITHSEFKQAFMDICRDPEIVDARMAELDYNKDQEITFREFIFGIASWVGFNDPVDETSEFDNRKDDDNKNDGDSNNDKNENENENGDDNGTNDKNENNNSNNDNNDDDNSGNNNNNKNSNDNSDNNENGDGKIGHEPTETEDASFLNKTDAHLESPKQDKQDKEENGKDASITGPPSSFMD